MSKVTQVTVRYGRAIQPKPYETKEAMLEAIVVSDPSGEVAPAEIDAVFNNLVDRVHAKLGDAFPAEAPVDNSTEDPPKETAKPRTRRTKKQIAEDKAKAEAANDEVPIDGAVDNSGKEVPIDGAETVVDEVSIAIAGTTIAVDDDTVSDTDLQAASAKAAGTHGTKVVKALMAEFGVALLGKLEQDKRPAFLAKLDEL